MFWGLAAFPTVVALRSQSVLAADIGMAILVAAMFLRTQRNARWRGASWALVVGAAFLPPILRATPDGALAFGILAALFVLMVALTVEVRAAVYSLVQGVGLYLIANAVLYNVVGLTSNSALTRNSGRSSFSDAERVFYPLATSVNLPANMAVVYVVGALPLLMATGSVRRRLMFVAGLVAAVVVIEGAGSRTSLAVGVAASLLALFAPRLLSATAPVLVGAAGVVSLVYAWVSGAAGAVLTFLASLFPVFERGPASTLSSLAGREDIWQIVLRAWRDAPLVEKVFGYGSDGQVASGASTSYSYLFRGWMQNPYEATAHNSTLQMLIDGGLVGAVLFLGVFVAATRGWSRTPGVVGRAGTTILVVLAFVSVTEVTTASGEGQETFWIFACLVLLAPVAATVGGPAPTPRKARSLNR